MSNSAVEIANLLYRYAEVMDAGDFEGVAALFKHAKVKVGAMGELQDSDAMLAIWTNGVKRYPCGTPRTKHVITNPIIEVDEAAGKATCRSYYTVFQSTETLKLQPIVNGRYHDAFERVDGKWRYSYRDYSLMDGIGDLSQHLQPALLGGLG